MKRRRISYHNLKKIILHFCIDIEASKTAILTGINRNTVNAYYSQFRKLIAAYQSGLISELRISQQADSRITSLLERMAPLTTKPVRKQIMAHPVYGIFVQNGRLYCELAFDKINRKKPLPLSGDGNQETLTGKGFIEDYQAILFGMSPQLLFIDKTKKRVPGKKGNEFIIESFWSFSRRRLNKFNGVNKHFYYHLKECEWRWKRNEQELLKELTVLLGPSFTRKFKGM
jgi:hypothetical protein